MKQNLLSILTIAMALSASAQQNSQILCQWTGMIDGSTAAGDQSTDVCIDKSGNVYWLGVYGTNPTNQDIKFNEQYLFTGDISDADNSQNNNYTLLKTDANGNKLWAVYSTVGDFANSAGGCAVTSDGGLVTISKVRHSKYSTDKNITLVDASGSETQIDWTCKDRYYLIMVNKISATGNIEWTRLIDVSTQPGPAAAGNYASFWSDCVNVPGGCVVDSDDNIYLPVNYRNPITIAKADGTSATLTPVNNKTWSGDSQSAAGDFLLLGLDSKGFYRNSLVLEGTAAAAYCQKLAYDNGCIYAQGYITGNGTDMKAGEFTISPTTVMSPLFLCTDTDLNVKWAKCYQGERVQDKLGLQNIGITVSDGYMWICGQYNLKMTDPDNSANILTATQGSIREGFILKLDAATGCWVAARNSRDDDWNNPSALAKTGLTGYLKILQNPAAPDVIYAFGYVMNMNVGVFLREYNAYTLEANLTTGQNNVVTGGGVPSCQAVAYDTQNNCVYLTARGNKAFSTMGNITSVTPAGWGVLMAKFSMPASPTSSISSIESNSNDAPVEYYNLQGIRVDTPQHRGIYIRRQGNKSTKVIF